MFRLIRSATIYRYKRQRPFFRYFSGQRKRRNEVLVRVLSHRNRHRHQYDGWRRAAPPLNRRVGSSPHQPSRVGSSSANTPGTPHLVGTSFFELFVRVSPSKKNPRRRSAFAGAHFRALDRAYTSKYTSQVYPWLHRYTSHKLYRKREISVRPDLDISACLVTSS